MTIKDDLHRLVDELPEEELHGAKRYLEYLRNMGDPVLRALREAPIDDEPSSPEERTALCGRSLWQEYLAEGNGCLLQKRSSASSACDLVGTVNILTPKGTFEPYIAEVAMSLRSGG